MAFMFALLGLYDVSRIGDASAKVLFERGVRTLAFAMPLYDADGRSIYDLTHVTNPPRKQNVVGRDYQMAHVAALCALTSITKPHRVLTYYRNLWFAHSP